MNDSQTPTLPSPAEVGVPAPEEAPAELQHQVRRLAWLAAWIVASLLGLEAAAWAGFYISPLASGIRNNHFYVFPLLSIALLYVASNPTRPQMLGVLLLCALITAGLHVLKNYWEWPNWPARDLSSPLFISLAQALGLACLIELTWRAARASGADRTQVLLYLLPCSLFLGFNLGGPYVMGLSTWLDPHTLDGVLHVADGSFGVLPSFRVGQWFEAVPALMWISSVVYNTNALAIIGVYLMQLRQRPLPPVDIYPAVILAAALAAPLYFLLPVCGPHGAFAQAFPHQPPTTSEVLGGPIISPIGEASTSMPSLHFTMILFVWWYSRALPVWWRVLAGVWVVFTALATLGLGLHYLLDLVVAVPFATAVQALCAPGYPLRTRAQRSALFWGAGLTAAWYLVLHFGWHWLLLSPALPILATVFTVAVCLRREAALYVPHPPVQPGAD